MTSCVWLMFYYYVMIVPSQRAIIRWVKKNIKSVIYVMLFGDRLLFLGHAAYEITTTLDTPYSNGTGLALQAIQIVELSIHNGYILLCLCVITLSSFATAHYLSKHMKSLAASDGSLFNPRLRSQIRVTITGILQGPALRNSDLERNGLYPFTGLPGSRHSCIYPSQWNPSFISDDSRRRDYF
ncbi:hypothetical protein NHX12_017233 [Muraenolepis orangiensis]|uniref:Uncharacterized protein n=1 Tax=Muraenolepis orangiensis TaxID=630683 RepID=A0A9Q0D4G5_9TELE|nr:hypothetical protein NHX12_017233 [Muraenolepis orangiensis]